LELSEYEGKGRRSYVIILEGYERKGWEEGQLQLQRLKLHHEKQKREVSLVGKLEGKKVGGKTSGVNKETKRMEVQVQQSYVETVVGDQGQGSALDSQVTGEVAPKLEKVQDKEIAAVNHALQDMERLEN
jgi:hypothetical protein